MKKIALLLTVVCLCLLSACASDNGIKEGNSSTESTDISKAVIRNISADLKDMDYFLEEDLYALYRYEAPKGANTLIISLKQYVDGKSVSEYTLLSVDSLDMKNKNGYIGIIRPMDEMYKIKVMNSSKTFSTTAAGKYANEGGYGEGAIESFSEFNHDCILNEEYPLYANIVSENGAGTGAYSEDFLDNAKSATAIIAEFRQ